MSEKRRFLVHSIIYGLGGIVNQIAPMILFPLYTNYLTPEEYGIIDIITRVTYFINVVFVVNGIRLAAFTFYRQAETEEEKRKVAVTLSLFLWIGVFVGIVFINITSGVLDVFLRINDPSLLAYGVSVSLLGSLTAIPMSLMQARLESFRFVLTNLLNMLMYVSLCVFFVAWTGMGVRGVITAQLISGMTFALYLTYRETKLGSLKPDFSLWKDVWKFCWPFIPGGIISFFYMNSDRFFIINFSNYASENGAMNAVGLYALASRLLAIISLFGVSAIAQVWTAKMYDYYKRDDASVIFGNYALKIFSVHILGALAVCLFSKDLITAICDSSYYGAAPLTIPFAIASCFSILNTQMEYIYYITRTTRYKPWIIAFMLLVSFIVMPLLVARWNVTGAAWGYMICAVVFMFVNYFITQHFFRVKYRWGMHLLLFLIAASLFFLNWLLPDGVTPSSIPAEQFAKFNKWEKLEDILTRFHFLPLLSRGGILVLFMMIIMKLKIFTADEKELMFNGIRRAFNKITSLFFRKT